MDVMGGWAEMTSDGVWAAGDEYGKASVIGYINQSAITVALCSGLLSTLAIVASQLCCLCGDALAIL